MDSNLNDIRVSEQGNSWHVDLTTPAARQQLATAINKGTGSVVLGAATKNPITFDFGTAPVGSDGYK